MVGDIREGDSAAVGLRRLSIEDLIGRIGDAIQAADRAGLAEYCDALFEKLKESGSPLDHAAARALLNDLRKARAFRELAMLGDRLIVLGRGEPDIRRLTAQGLIDAGQPAAALDVLNSLFENEPADDADVIDARGLQGRARKQIYVDPKEIEGTPRRERPFASALRDAVASYETGYRASRGKGDPPTTWSFPAINVVACLNRAMRDGIDADSALNPEMLANEIIEELETRGGAKTPWDSATIAEAYISRGDWENAAKWCVACATRNDTDAFTLASFVRQLEEVWQLKAGPDAPGKLLFELKSRLLAKSGAQLSLTPADRLGLLQVDQQPASRLEAILSYGRSLPINWLNIGLERANAVGKVTTLRDWPQGTGFLVRGGDFIPSYGDKPLFLTNAHVLSELRSELEDPHAALHPKKAKVHFTSVGEKVKRREYTCRKVVLESPRSALDFALVELHPDIQEIPICDLADRVPVPETTRLLIIGHPDGRPLEISLFEAPLLQVGHKSEGDPAHKYLHYTNPTEGGSSGSPVFEAENWTVVGLHHAGSVPQAKLKAGKQASPSGVANEGILIHSIREAAGRMATNRTSVAVGGQASALGAGSAGTFQSAAGPAAHAPAAGPAAAAAGTPGKLAHDIPRVMTDWKPQKVKARISRHNTSALLDGLRAQSGVAVEDIAVSAVMSVRLVAPAGGFTIQALSPETQFVGEEQGALTDVSEWAWSVRPETTGHHQLELVLALREQRAGGIADLPGRQQKIPVRVRVNVGRRLGGVARWAAVAVGSGALALLGQSVLKSQLAQPLLKFLN